MTQSTSRDSTVSKTAKLNKIDLPIIYADEQELQAHNSYFDDVK